MKTVLVNSYSDGEVRATYRAENNLNRDFQADWDSSIAQAVAASTEWDVDDVKRIMHSEFGWKITNVQVVEVSY